MARDNLSAAALSHYEGEHFREILFARLDFALETIRVSDAPGSVTWGGHTWEGLGDLAQVTNVQESAGLAARNLTLVLNGLDPTLVSYALDRTDYKGRPVELFVGVLDENGDLIGDPGSFWRGYMDVATATVDKGVGLIELSCEHELIGTNLANISRFSDEDHKLRAPTDRFYEFAASMIDKTVAWGDFVIASRGGGPIQLPRWDFIDTGDYNGR